MVKKYILYKIIVHGINWILLGIIGIVAYFSVVNITPPTNDTYSGLFTFVTFSYLLITWAINYWIQYKKRKWYLPIVGTILFFVSAAFLFMVILPIMNNLLY